MKQFNILNQIWVVIGVLVVGVFFLSSTTYAQQLVVFNHYQEIPDKKAQLSQVIDKEVSKRLVGVKGLEWTKFLYNPLTGERGSIFIWTSQKDWEAYQQSDLRKELVSKVKPFIQGDVSSKSYPVYEPKK